MATQMQQAREGRTTDAMKIVAEEERIPVETIRERVANGTIAICANINHKNLRPRGVFSDSEATIMQRLRQSVAQQVAGVALYLQPTQDLTVDSASGPTEFRFDLEGVNTAQVNEWAQRLAELARTQDIVVLCEGDPFFYGSFMHLYTRLQGRAQVDVVPGIPGMVGCWWVTGQPMTWGDDVMTVLMGTLPEDTLAERMQGADAVEIGRAHV